MKDFIRAAQSDIVVSALQTKDQRNQVIQDTVLSYAELAGWEQRLSHLHETMTAADQVERAIAQRVKEGVDSEIDGSKARLSVARVRLRHGRSFRFRRCSPRASFPADLDCRALLSK